MQTRLEQLESMEKQLATKLNELKEWREPPERKKQIDEVLQLSDRISDLRSQPLYRGRTQDIQALREEMDRQIIELQDISKKADKLPLFTGFGRFWQYFLIVLFGLIGLANAVKGAIYGTWRSLVETYYCIPIVGCLLVIALLERRLAYDRNMVRLGKEARNLHGKLNSLENELEAKSLELEKALAGEKKILTASVKDGEVPILRRTNQLNDQVTKAERTGHPFVCKICRPLVILIAFVAIVLCSVFL